MKLLVTTPTALILEVSEVCHVRAEDETGAFGIQPGHADFLTVLTISVITWRDAANATHHIAVRGGLLSVRGGELIEIATREAVGEDTLRRLGAAVLSRFQEEEAQEIESRTATARLHMATIRQVQRFLESGRQAAPLGAPPSLQPAIARRSPPGEGESA